MDFERIVMIVVGGAVGLMFGLIGKALWDHQKVGRVERRAVYTLETDCEKRRLDCCVPILKKDIAQMDTRLKETEKQLGQGRSDFKIIIEDISLVKQSLAGMPNHAEFEGMKRDLAAVSKSLSGIEAVIKYVLDDKKRGE